MLNEILTLFSNALPFYRAAQDAGIDMVDIEGLAHYMLSSVITKMGE